jgi:GTP-binding protein HflX
LLFATLDPTMRDVKIPGFDKAILSDTVGFVSNLPTELVAAFRATLEEVSSADLILHVRDISHPDTEAQKTDVETVLASLGLDEEGAPPRLEVWNKVDLLQADEREALLNEAARREDVLPISALDGRGVDQLRDEISSRLRGDAAVHHVRLGVGDGSRLAWLHSRGEVLDSRAEGETIDVAVRLSPENWTRFQAL